MSKNKILAAWSGCVFAVASCSGLGPDASFLVDDGGGGSSFAGGGDDGVNGQGGAVEITSPNDEPNWDACAELTEEATLIPVNMFLAVDRSLSMLTDSKWKNAKAAFISFFENPEADSLNVALRFWPGDGCGGLTNWSCNPDPCSKPEVALGSLGDPKHEKKLVKAFKNKNLIWGTPMYAALEGATNWCLEQQSKNKGAEFSVVVLLTDGEPTQCDGSASAMAALASQAHNKADVLTFAVGLQGSSESLMNTIAQAGQTQKGYFIGNGNAKDDLLTALKDIQKKSSPCAFAMPTSDDPNAEIDLEKINVMYTPEGSTNTQTIPQVANEAACTSQGGGWYYDDPTDPKLIRLCPATCLAIQGYDAGKFEIIIGCKTVIN